MNRSCRSVTKDQLANPILVKTEGSHLDFRAAKSLADQQAAAVSSDPMLLAWYDAGAGRYSPTVECCGEDKPAWLIYAEARGGNIVVDINDEEFIFVYLDASG